MSETGETRPLSKASITGVPALAQTHLEALTGRLPVDQTTHRMGQDEDREAQVAEHGPHRVRLQDTVTQV